ncbi:heme ABC exporter ATP-binding protein CcmA [Thermoleophilia bacterium SCSIO 60948]|nr:heme ABC exporter ATP-binding protein CcmA [Thermoleophilia bacterium SCSIO 60948]
MTASRSAASGASAGSPGLSTHPPAVEVRGLHRERGERWVLRDVSFELPTGRTLAVLGPNGAGKTTLLRILATLLRPTEGTVRALGAELPREAWQVRGRIGMLAHEPLLYRELSVRENLEFNAALHRIANPAEQIAELIDRVGLGRRGDELVRNLSAGMRQRAAVCRAVLHDPDLLLLDEPGAHLDPVARELCERLIGPRAGRTRIIVAHEVDRALADSERVLVLGAGGRVAYEGPSAAIRAEAVREIYGTGEVG